MKTESKKSFVQKVQKFTEEVNQERKKVTWPSRRETLLTTVFVFIFSLVASIYFVFVDKIIVALLDLIKGF